MIQEIVFGIAAAVQWTVAVTAVSFVIGLLLAIPLCGTRRSRYGTLRFLASLIILALRSIPPLLLVFIAYFGLGGVLRVSAFQAATLGLGLISAANMAEIFRGSYTAIHAGQWDAANALNLPPRSRFVDVIGPQLLRVSLPSLAGYMVGLLKDSAIASTIGVTEITFVARQITQQTYKGLEVFAVAGSFYILMSLPIAALARQADKRMRARVSV